MKFCIIFLLSFVALINNSFSQKKEKKPDYLMTRQDYLTKSKQQRIAAWILFGAGVISIAAVSSGNSDFGTTGTFAVLGGAAILGSIPLFIAAGRNKRKARRASVFLNIERNPFNQIVSKDFSAAPSLCVKLNLFK